MMIARTQFAILFAVGVPAQSLEAGAPVHLEWWPSHRAGEPEDIVEFQLAVRTDGPLVPVTALDAILLWDPLRLEMLEPTQAGASYVWLAAGFLDDPDGVNDPPGLTPLANDGCAMFTAFAQPASPAMVGPDGLVITTIRLRILDVEETAHLSFGEAIGEYARTRVLGEGIGNDVTGDITSQAAVRSSLPIPTLGYWGGVCMLLSTFVAGSCCFGRTLAKKDGA